jgi:hypothetical protein
LEIIDAKGELTYSTAWKGEWHRLLFWHDQENLVFNVDEIAENKINLLIEPGPVSIYNFQYDEQQILLPNFSESVQISGNEEVLLFRNVYPYWNGQYGVAYDPTLTRAIYLRYIEERNLFTYGIWDLVDIRLTATLEDIYRSFTTAEDIRSALIPHWSPDGSDFLVISAPYFFEETNDDDEWDLSYLEMELYRVNRDGDMKQLTYLNPLWSVEDFNLSWSPNERYVAMFIRPYYESPEKIRLAVLNTETLEIMDTCIDVGYSINSSPPPPVWSPYSNQFLVWDRDENNNNRVILYDLERGAASILGENMEPVGWLKSR